MYATMKNPVRKLMCVMLVTLLSVFVWLPADGKQLPPNIYANPENWTYLETETKGKIADVFFICPTVYGGAAGSYNMSLTYKEAVKESFLGATKMEKGIYDADSRFFAPYYRQAGLNVYQLNPSEREQYLAIAYNDVRDAFKYYLQHYNKGRGIILAGFSQGADMCIRLVKDCFADKNTNKLLIACYAIGWSVSEKELTKYPHVRFAAGETDTGVIISFNSEAENVENSLMIPKGGKTLAINPLNWKTDGTVADKSLNLGACFTDYSGKITTEIPYLTGAYIDDTRGALKVTDVTPQKYPPVLDIFEEGVYHFYDYQFFYRNLEENVKVRIAAFVNGG